MDSEFLISITRISNYECGATTRKSKPEWGLPAKLLHIPTWLLQNSFTLAKKSIYQKGNPTGLCWCVECKVWVKHINTREAQTFEGSSHKSLPWHSTLICQIINHGCPLPYYYYVAHPCSLSCWRDFGTPWSWPHLLVDSTECREYYWWLRRSLSYWWLLLLWYPKLLQWCMTMIT